MVLRDSRESARQHRNENGLPTHSKQPQSDLHNLIDLFKVKEKWSSALHKPSYQPFTCDRTALIGLTIAHICIPVSVVNPFSDDPTLKSVLQYLLANIIVQVAIQARRNSSYTPGNLALASSANHLIKFDQLNKSEKKSIHCTQTRYLFPRQPGRNFYLQNSIDPTRTSQLNKMDRGRISLRSEDAKECALLGGHGF